MELTPEERRKIYEEEKARLEAREQLEREKKKTSADTITSITPNVAGLLCYLGFWVTGIIFLVLEKKNKWIRFHAMQSILVFGSLSILSGLFGWIPFIGPVFSGIFWIIGVILWIVLMVKAYNGEYFKLPVAGDIAEMIANSTGSDAGYRKPPESPGKQEGPPQPGAYDKTETGEKPEPAASFKDLDKRISRSVDNFFERRRAGRITASTFIIAWSIVLIIFFNFFYQYVAYYHATTAGGILTWERYPFFTDDIRLWLPILNATLIISIASHVILIVYDRYVLRQALRIVTDILGLATVITLISVFPFDFNVIPDTSAAAGTQIGLQIVLILLAVGFGIGILVRFIKLVVNVLRGTATYPKSI